MTDDGLCECGCGEPTNVSRQNHKRFGWVRGRPKRFKRGHAGRGQPGLMGEAHPGWRGGRSTTGAYVNVKARGHARGGRKGYVKEHILVVERAMGKPLPPKAEIHHFDGDKHNNSPGNLVVCPGRAYHFLLHQRQRAKAACGHPEWVQCYYCKVWGPLGEMSGHKTTAKYHKPCINAFHADLKARRQAVAVGSPAAS